MTRFHFERPDESPDSSAQNILQHLNRFIPPQGFPVKAPIFFDLTLDNFNTGITFSSDGKTMFVIGQEFKKVYQFNVPTPFDLSSNITLTTSFTFNSSDTTFPTDVTFDTNGDKMFISSFAPASNILQYALNDSFDLTNPPVGTPDKFTVSEVTTPTGVVFEPNGNKMFVADNDMGDVTEYDVPTSFDITSGLTENTTLLLPGFFAGVPFDITFNPDGTKLFATDTGSGDGLIFQYSVAVGFDLTSTVLEENVFDIDELDSSPWGIIFSNDGLRLFVVGNENKRVIQIFLKTAFEIPGTK